MIILKTAGEIDTMAEAARVVAETLEVLKKEVRPGITTEYLDRIAEENIRMRGALPAFKGYRNYPRTLCASDRIVSRVLRFLIPKPKLFCSVADGDKTVTNRGGK